SAMLLPGLWQILVGLLGFSVVRSLPRNIVWVSAWYFACGAGVLMAAARVGQLQPWMMGVPLVLGQLMVAVIMNHAEKEIASE
ncbi:hypothetical protein, partial [Mangrovimicrobium sediminis]|uniref:hypothetical protein n=1 Tax=Mangrovimicrobium sediminis TaxID=2562682 RepID=UPI0019805E7A